MYLTSKEKQSVKNSRAQMHAIIHLAAQLEKLEHRSRGRSESGGQITKSSTKSTCEIKPKESIESETA